MAKGEDFFTGLHRLMAEAEANSNLQDSKWKKLGIMADTGDGLHSDEALISEHVEKDKESKLGTKIPISVLNFVGVNMASSLFSNLPNSNPNAKLIFELFHGSLWDKLTEFEHSLYDIISLDRRFEMMCVIKRENHLTEDELAKVGKLFEQTKPMLSQSVKQLRIACDVLDHYSERLDFLDTHATESEDESFDLTVRWLRAKISELRELYTYYVYRWAKAGKI